ncbi:hypothetical protein M758_UG026100 [Ceratodon purpureus]|nr:hypothetical protein M758_UG026100 [Ceratodon purpureus]
MDIENARMASPMWREVIDASAEWAAVRLTRWDYMNEVGAVWEPFETYEINKFLLNWGALGQSWRMNTPLASCRLRLDPIGTLNCVELDVLRRLLWDPENKRIEVEDGEVLEPAGDIWVSPPHRA